MLGEMKVGKFLSIAVESLAYPFKNIGSLIVPFLLSLLLVVPLAYMLMVVNLGAYAEGSLMGLGTTLVDAVLIVAWIIVIAPLFVAVTRDLVIGEKVEPFVLKGLLQARTYQVVFAWIKLLLIYLVPIAVFGYMGGLIFGEKFGDPLFSIGGLVVGKGHLMLFVGFLVGLFYLIRGSMATVTAAIDIGFSIRNSFSVTRGHALQIFLAVLFLIILMGLLMGLFFYIAGLFGVVWDAGALMAMPLQGKLMLITEMVAARLLISIMFVAALAKVYLVIANKS
jgi:hypothetical protein